MMKVLIVDDMASLRTQMREALENCFECEIAEASDGAEAVAMAKTFKPDVILMDVEMGGMNGVDATRSIVGNGLAGKVIMVTGAKNPSTVIESIKAGAVNYVRKPVEFESLLRIIRNTAATRKQEENGTVMTPQNRMNIPKFAPIYQ